MPVEETAITTVAIMELATNDPEAYAEWSARWQADRAIVTIPLPRRRSGVRRFDVMKPTVHAEDIPALTSRSPRTLWAKAREFLRAQFGPRVSRKEYRLRLSICAACPKRTEAAGKAYCGACGCPKWAPAELRRKAKLKAAHCPIGKWPVV